MSLKYQVIYHTGNYEFEDGADYSGLVRYIEHLRYGQCHRDNQPAMLWTDGELVWYQYDHEMSRNTDPLAYDVT